MIDLFKVAKDIEKLWEDEKLDKKKFSQIAFEYLNSLIVNFELNEIESLVAQLTIKKELPKQLNVYNNFGQPPVTIFNNGKFVVDLYFWQDIDTSIHSHSFCGAFKVISGRSFHEVYEMKKLIEYAPDVVKTELILNRSELLQTGDVREIIAGNSFNHRVVHLDNPTVTLCVRTIDQTNEGQWHHFSNGLSIEKREIDESEIKSLFVLEYLLVRGNDSAQSFIEELLDSWDISLTMNIFEQLLNDGMGLKPDIANYLVDYISSKYAEQEWFQIYEEYYSLMEEYIRLEDDSPSARFIEVALNGLYPLEISIPLLETIQSVPANDEQLEQLSARLED
jgi:hypothetical protein